MADSIYLTMAALVAATHAMFLLLVVLGGPLLLRWPAMAWLQVPAAVWGVTITVLKWTCPLTDLEQVLRTMGGRAGYEGPFIDHYCLSLLEVAQPSRQSEIVLAGFLAAVNIVSWGLAWRAARKKNGEECET